MMAPSSTATCGVGASCANRLRFRSFPYQSAIGNPRSASFLVCRWRGYDGGYDAVRRYARRWAKPNARYYNDVRTHRSLAKDASVSRPIKRDGSITSFAILGGLHHR